MQKVWNSTCYFTISPRKSRVRKHESLDFRRMCRLFLETSMKKGFLFKKPGNPGKYFPKRSLEIQPLWVRTFFFWNSPMWWKQNWINESVIFSWISKPDIFLKMLLYIKKMTEFKIMQLWFVVFVIFVFKHCGRLIIIGHLNTRRLRDLKLSRNVPRHLILIFKSKMLQFIGKNRGQNNACMKAIAQF